MNTSSSRACGTRPSRITAASTPCSTASRQVSIFGIMPPVIVPSAVRARASSMVSWGTRRLSRSRTPATSVSRNSRDALIAAATAPAAVSALMLKVSPCGPIPIGAMTGMKSVSSSTSRISGLTCEGSPTKPRSRIFSMLLSGSRLVRRSLRAWIRFAVLAGQAQRLAADRMDRRDDLLVDRARQDHLDHVHRSPGRSPAGRR